MFDQIGMDELAYSSRMVEWAPLGKLCFVLGLLILGLVTNNILVPIVTFCIGIFLMAYSTNMRLPTIIVLAIAESVFIMVIGCGVVSILGSHSDPAIFQGKVLWFEMYMTVYSFNFAWLIFFRAIAGVTLMLAFASSTPIPHLAQACRRLHLPAEITEIVVLIYRYAFLLLERFVVMWDAAKGRMGFREAMQSLRTTAMIFVGIFISSLEISERSEAALDSRNYRGSFPVYRMPRQTSWVWVVGTVMLVAVLYLIGVETSGCIDMASLLGVA
ncbi:MAG: energy-coupling factor transporter transmembrane component T [Candidatus Methanomethylophilus sp.]|nr:energy-coupling factor transporter transmembrane component T [Methanomethylophilus sp.]